MSFACACILPICMRIPSVWQSYVLVCHPYVTGISSVCHSYVLICHSYVTRMYSYVIRISLVCGFTMNHLALAKKSCNKINNSRAQVCRLLFFVTMFWIKEVLKISYRKDWGFSKNFKNEFIKFRKIIPVSNTPYFKNVRY